MTTHAQLLANFLTAWVEYLDGPLSEREPRLANAIAAWDAYHKRMTQKSKVP